jgi:hypothetical protein
LDGLSVCTDLRAEGSACVDSAKQSPAENVLTGKACESCITSQVTCYPELHFIGRGLLRRQFPTKGRDDSSQIGIKVTTPPTPREIQLRQLQSQYIAYH